MFKHFSLSEFSCRCCGQSQMNLDFVMRLDKARMIAETSFKINSGYRCEKHNIEVGSTSKNHTSGHGADIDAQNNSKRGMILRGLYKAGFKRIGIRKDFIHVDDVGLHERWKAESCWLYD